MNCWDCGSFNSSLAEACEDCGAPLDVEHVDKGELERRRARGVKKRQREKLKRNQRAWASLLLGLGVVAMPLGFLYKRHAALSSARLLGLTTATVVPEVLGWVIFGAVCAVVLFFSSAKRAWTAFGLAVGLGVARSISDVARAGDFGVLPSVLLLSLAAYMLHESLRAPGVRQR